MNNNKLIAEFMELETSDGCYFKHLTKKGNIELTHHILLQYHISWDWLMPVVEKIDDMFGNDNQVDDSINKVHNAVLLFDIDESYQAVIEFIKNYE